jgi:hypothetical protein
MRPRCGHISSYASFTMRLPRDARQRMISPPISGRQLDQSPPPSLKRLRTNHPWPKPARRSERFAVSATSSNEQPPDRHLPDRHHPLDSPSKLGKRQERERALRATLASGSRCTPHGRRFGAGTPLARNVSCNRTKVHPLPCLAEKPHREHGHSEPDSRTTLKRARERLGAIR